MRRLALFAMVFLVLPVATARAAIDCTSLRGEPAILVQLFFGRSVQGRAEVSDTEWRSFLRSVLTPAFPDGFTVLDARGQWLNPREKRLVAERTKVVLISAPRTPETMAKVEIVIGEWKQRFRQLSAGSAVSEACSAF